MSGAQAPDDGVDGSEADRTRATMVSALLGGERGVPAADRLCVASLTLLGVDAAAISVIDDGESRGTFGASGPRARLLDSMQFTCGEGPCLEAAYTASPVLVADLHAQIEPSWPAFRDAAERAGIRAVFAVPVRVGRVGLGALDLFRADPGPLSSTQMNDALLVADVAAQVLLDVADIGANGEDRAGPLEQWEQVASLARIDVYQATGMIMAQLEVPAALALVRLRAYAFANELTASEVAQLVIARSLRLDEWR
jgi:GAF domain